ncbi:MAG: HIRAN domain-containing protein [Candidatus Sericytochromatia bacterium]|nr:HIRAN domain-containing protein [Candidatus Sericytochromatia bacterium]
MTVLLVVGALILLALLAGTPSKPQPQNPQLQNPWPDVMPVAGVSFRQEIVEQCEIGDIFALELDPFGETASKDHGGSLHDDPFAVLVRHTCGMVGYVPRSLNRPVYEAIDSGLYANAGAVVVDTVGGGPGYYYGLRISLELRKKPLA